MSITVRSLPSSPIRRKLTQMRCRTVAVHRRWYRSLWAPTTLAVESPTDLFIAFHWLERSLCRFPVTLLVFSRDSSRSQYFTSTNHHHSLYSPYFIRCSVLQPQYWNKLLLYYYFLSFSCGFSQLFTEGLVYWRLSLHANPTFADCFHSWLVPQSWFVTRHALFRSILKMFEYAAKRACKQMQCNQAKLLVLGFTIKRV